MNNLKLRVLMEMRPALEGFAGIPQETRLLFRLLCKLDELAVEGMLLTGHRILARGVRPRNLFDKRLTQARRLNRFSRVVISMAEQPYRTPLEVVGEYLTRKVLTSSVTMATLLGLAKLRLTHFDTELFKDFAWRTMFSKTLPAIDFSVVTAKNYRVCSVPWTVQHLAGLNSLTVHESPRYPRLDTRDVDVFVSQTPYPASFPARTQLIVRYHDAIPVLMPHTISDKSLHQASHFYALMHNVKSGAYFACVSESTRKDLLQMFPEIADRAVTIHNSVSPHYYPEDAPFERVAGIIRARLYAFDQDAKDLGLAPKFLSIREQERFYGQHISAKPFQFLLAVSTIEPRKNHARLLSAWEVLKAETDPDLKLVIVGTLGWGYKELLKSAKTWIDRGQLFMLNQVPAPDLRVLYRHAAATVCPSLGEGFDYSGVESMRSGGVVIASDIPVHREVYDHAAEYFDPYSTLSLANSVRKVLYSDAARQIQGGLRDRGEQVATRYLSESILPQWHRFLQRFMRNNHG